MDKKNKSISNNEKTKGKMLNCPSIEGWRKNIYKYMTYA